MNYGLSLTANDRIDSLVEKGVEAENVGIDCLWIFDRPSDIYAPLVASAIASRTGKMNLGLGLTPLLHSPKQISAMLNTLIKRFGERYELCLIPGDKFHLSQVGITMSWRNVHEAVIQTKNQVQLSLRKENLRCKIWLGAQGPKMIKLASMFDGALLNFASARMISWAMETLAGAVGKNNFDVGVIAPSYVYTNYIEKFHRLLQLSSAAVAQEAAPTIKKKLGWLASQQNLTMEKPSLELVPLDVASEFSIFMPSEKFIDYVSVLKSLGVNHVIFAYPQDQSIETIHELQRVLRVR